MGTLEDLQALKGELQGNIAPQGQGLAGPERPQIGQIEAGLLGGAQGITLGFSDEFEAGIRALSSKVGGDARDFGDVFDESVAGVRERIKLAQQQQPGAFTVGEFAGGAALPGGLALRGATALARAGSGGLRRAVIGAGEGAVTGAAFGAGTAEGGLEQRLDAALSNARLGAALGAAAPGAARVAGAVGSRIAAPFQSLVNREGFAAGKVAEAFRRDQKDVGRSLDDLRRLQGEDVTLTLADVGGENVRDLLRTASNISSEGRQALTRRLDIRQQGIGRRVGDSLGVALGDSRSFFRVTDDLIERRRLQANDDFERAFDAPLRPRAELGEILNTPALQDATRRMRTQLANERVAFAQLRPLETLHRVKIQLDDMIRLSRRGDTSVSAFNTRGLVNLKQDYLAAINSRPYRAALRRFSGGSSEIDALETARVQFFRMQPEEIRSFMRGASQAEREMFRLGAARQIAERIGERSLTSNVVRTIFNKQGVMNRLRAAFPDLRSFREFQRALIIQNRKSLTREAVQGNSTTARQLINAQEAGTPAGLADDLATAATEAATTGGIISPIVRGVQRAGNRLTGLTPGSAGEIIGQLTGPAGAQSSQAAIRQNQLANALLTANRRLAGGPQANNALASALLGGSIAATTP